jgi:8-oxo-dGTP pyrophosphatase MutT (NUDIX family)
MMDDVALRGSEGRGNNLFMRHVLACRNVELPGERLPFYVGPHRIGFVTRDFARKLLEQPEVERILEGIRVRDPDRLPGLARQTAELGLHGWRDEAFDVRAHVSGPVLAQMDRGALPAYGIESLGAHVNGIVEGPEGTRIWIAHRAPSKALDPGKLDNIVAGGVPAGMTPEQTILKEAAEEASIPASLAGQARRVGQVRYAMKRPEGLRRDTLFCYDLLLPTDFRPVPNDDEVVGFELWSLRRMAETVAGTDSFKFNVNLVIIDLLIRRGMIRDEDAAELQAALQRNAQCP